MSQEFKVRTLHPSEVFFPNYGNSIGSCKASFERDRVYTAVVFSGIYQSGQHLTHDFMIDVFTGTLDGYDRPVGQSYRTLTEFNAEFAVIE